jgi:hypothetical protein
MGFRSIYIFTAANQNMENTGIYSICLAPRPGIKYGMSRLRLCMRVILRVLQIAGMQNHIYAEIAHACLARLFSAMCAISSGHTINLPTRLFPCLCS